MAIKVGQDPAVEIVFNDFDFGGCSLDPAAFEMKPRNLRHNELYNAIEDALMFASASYYGIGDNWAVLDRETGKTYCQSDSGDMDEVTENLGEDFDRTRYLQIPDKQDLDLGKNIVFDFAAKFMPDAYDKVEQIFRKRGAYSKYKNLLDSMGMLQKWYDFENYHEQVALLNWCKENDIVIEDD